MRIKTYQKKKSFREQVGASMIFFSQTLQTPKPKHITPNILQFLTYQHHRRSPPEANTFKANNDANLLISRWWGFGAIVRNNHGLVLAAATWRLHGSNKVIIAEALALLFTIRLALDCGFRRMVFEANNQRVIRLVQNEKEEEDRSYLGQIISVIRKLQSRFTSVILDISLGLVIMQLTPWPI